MYINYVYYSTVVVYLSKQSWLCSRYTDAVSFKPIFLWEKKKAQASFSNNGLTETFMELPAHATV